jgi:pimeloyl-ACP methyl ester carboxylesterase
MRTTDLSLPGTAPDGSRARAGGLAADNWGRSDHRAPLVLLHGLTFNRAIWRPIVAGLQRIDPGRRVLSIDLPGHGESPAQPSYDLTAAPAQLHQEIEAAGLTAPVIVGHSAGGIAATIYAARYPASGVISVDQPLQVGEFARLVKSLAARLRGPEFPAVWQMFYDSFRTELLPPGARELVRSTSRADQQVVLGYWQQLIDRPAAELSALVQDAVTALRAAGTPYRYIAGDEPPPGYRQWLGQHLPAATIEVWPGSGHFPHLARPDEFAEQLAATAGWATRQP